MRGALTDLFHGGAIAAQLAINREQQHRLRWAQAHQPKESPHSASSQQAIPQLKDVAISETTEADRPVCGADTQRQNYLVSRW